MWQRVSGYIMDLKRFDPALSPWGFTNEPCLVLNDIEAAAEGLQPMNVGTFNGAPAVWLPVVGLDSGLMFSAPVPMIEKRIPAGSTLEFISTDTTQSNDPKDDPAWNVKDSILGSIVPVATAKQRPSFTRPGRVLAYEGDIVLVKFAQTLVKTCRLVNGVAQAW